MNWQDRILIAFMVAGAIWLITFVGHCSVTETCLRGSWGEKSQQRTAAECGFK
jgi:hypothetical protein